jgi:hypothetical protein
MSTIVEQIKNENNQEYFLKVLNGMHSHNDCSLAIEYAKDQIKNRPIKPAKPRLNINHSVQDVKQYVIDLEIFEKQLQKYELDIAEHNQKVDAVHRAIESYIKDQTGLNSVVPKQYQDKVYAYAYDKGHSDGYYEVYLVLYNLVSIFE